MGNGIDFEIVSNGKKLSNSINTQKNHQFRLTFRKNFRKKSLKCRSGKPADKKSK